MQQVYGNIDSSINSKELLKINEEINNTSLIKHWEKCSEIANSLAQQIATIDTSLSKDLISHIINELIENAVKYSTESTINSHIQCKLFKNTCEIRIHNVTNNFYASKFNNYIEDTFKEDLEDIFFKYLLQAAESDNKNSGIGLLIIRKDFNAKVGLKINEEPRIKDAFNVEVKIQVNTKDLML